MKMEFEVVHFINRDLVIFKLGTVRGRHQMPVENYIFEEDITDFNIIQIESHIEKYLKNLLEAYCEMQAPCLTLEELRERCDFRIDLYITGLTSVTTSAIKMCRRQGLNLTIFHYDPTTQDYQKQHMG